jgi:uncharacterized membrane protein YfcA
MFNDFIPANFLLLTIAAFFLGLDKGGFRNLAIICMYLLLSILPSKEVIGILAPIYLLGDIVPITIYRKDINVKAVKYFAPLAIIGIIITSFFASNIDDRKFTIFISFFILLMVMMVSYQEISKYLNKKRDVPKKEKELSKPLTLFLSFMAGITTVSNAAGAITCIYFFKQTNKKQAFVGSSALFFFILNLTKIIIFIFFWKNITLETLQITLSMMVGLFVGIGASIFLIKIIPQKIFNIIVLISVYYVGIMLFVKNVL